MSPRIKDSVLFLCAGALCAVVVILISLGSSIVVGQSSAPRNWNPRRVSPGTEFIGDQACGECHKKSFYPFAKTGMALAMERVAESKILKENPKLTLQLGPYFYEIKRQGRESLYSVTDGKNTISVPIQYALGQGRMGQTFVLQYNGKYPN